MTKFVLIGLPSGYGLSLTLRKDETSHEDGGCSGIKNIMQIKI